MPTKPLRPEDINPASILDIRYGQTMEDGSNTVNILMPYVPEDQFEKLGKVLAVAIGKYRGLSDADADVLAERVVGHLRQAAFETLRHEH